MMKATLRLMALLPLAALVSVAGAGPMRMGINLDNFNTSTPEIPFINFIKTSQGFSGCANLDADGYPQSGTTGCRITVLDHIPGPQGSVVAIAGEGSAPVAGTSGTFIGNFSRYPTGAYVLTWSGVASFLVSGDAVGATAVGANEIDFTVNKPSDAGVTITLTSNDPGKTGNPVRNVQLFEGKNRAALAAGALYRPEFLSAMANFSTIRGMGWLDTNENFGYSSSIQTLADFGSRPKLSNVGFNSSGHGIPVDAFVALCNAVNADCWINTPPLATMPGDVPAGTDFVTQEAQLIHAQLGPNQKAYVEFSNETWNSGFPAMLHFENLAHALWPKNCPSTPGPYGGMGGGDVVPCGQNYVGMQAARMCDAWKTAWGSDAGRVVCVMAGQDANVSGTIPPEANCPFWTAGAPCVKHGIGAFATAPYYGSNNAPGCGDTACYVSKMQAAVAGESGTMANLVNLAKQYGVMAVTYEGGPTNSCNGKCSSADEAMLAAANGSPGMGGTVTALLNSAASAGVNLFNWYDFASSWDRYGQFGLTPNIQALGANPPPAKWTAALAAIGPLSTYHPPIPIPTNAPPPTSVPTATPTPVATPTPSPTPGPTPNPTPGPTPVPTAPPGGLVGLNFSATPLIVPVGGSAAIKWTTAHASSCMASGTTWKGPQGIVGSWTMEGIKTSRVLTLSCTGSGPAAGRTDTQTVTITVMTPAPTPTPTPNPCTGK